MKKVTLIGRDFLKVLGILGSHKSNGVTRMMLDAVLNGVEASNEVELLNLNDYQIKPRIPGEDNPTLDLIIEKLKTADVWILAAPTYWGGLSGVMKNFLDCIRQEILRFDRKGDPHPIPEFAHKHYITLTNCYVGKAENMLTGMTDSAFRTMDKAMTTAGLIKLGEGVQTATYGLKQLTDKKQAELEKLGNKINQTQRKDDQTLKRYIELFFIVAVMALITMVIQAGILKLLGQVLSFWTNYISFVLIFFILLAITLHFFTVVKHRRK